MSAVEQPAGRKKSETREFFKILAQALLVAVVIRTLFFQPFNIPSGSMEETLLIGDYIFVSKYSYGYSRYSMPFGPPLFSGRIWAERPARGDVAVFKLPRDNETDYIKRVIGLPGDTVQMIDGRLSLNGELVERELLEADTSNGERAFSKRQRYRETLPNGVSYIVHDITKRGQLDNTGIYRVPEDHYFMMGDNRDNSNDSRVLSLVGFVPFENFVGRAEIVAFSMRSDKPAWQFWRWLSDIRRDRFWVSL